MTRRALVTACAVAMTLAPAILGEPARQERGSTRLAPRAVDAFEPRVEREELGTGTVVAHQKISSDAGGFTDTLDENDHFGSAVVGIGDFDGDGVEDVAVGAEQDRDGDQAGSSFTDGAVWLLFLHPDKTVKRFRKIEGDAGFGFNLGVSLANLGDVDGDGVVDLAMGVKDRGPGFVGGVWVVFLAPDGTIKSRRRIGQNQGGFTGDLDSEDFFGEALAALGDLDGDGITELAVSARGDDDGGAGAGAVWVLFLAADGTVKSHQKISRTEGGLAPDGVQLFGRAVAGLGDVDGDGVADMAVGVGPESNRVWVLFLNADGTVARQQIIDETEGGFTGSFDDQALFGDALASPGDLDGDGVRDLLVGADNDEDTPGGGRGTLWVLFLNADGTVESHTKVGAGQGGFTGNVVGGDRFATSIAALGDLDGDGIDEFACGALGLEGSNDNAGFNSGGVWILSLEQDGTVAGQQEISSDHGGFEGTLDDGDLFGTAVARLGDLDGDGIDEIAAGAPRDDDGASLTTGALWVLFPDAGGAVKRYQKISQTHGGLPDILDFLGGFGSALAGVGDLDGDGFGEVAVGAPGEDHAGVRGSGTVRLLFLDAQGSVRFRTRIRTGESGFTGVVDGDDGFGSALAGLGDLDRDGVGDLAVGASGDDDANAGAVWVLFLHPDGTVKAHQKISALEGDFGGTLALGDGFGAALASPGDLNGDGVSDLAVGAAFADDGGPTRGAVWILFLRRDGTVKDQRKISATSGLFAGELHDNDRFGSSLGAMGDLNGDGRPDLAVGSPGDDDGNNRGALWLLFLKEDGTVGSQAKISHLEGGFGGVLGQGEALGAAVAGLGDLDGDGVVDLVAGVPGGDDGGIDHGALFVMSLDGIATIDFEGGDDQARTPLEPGRSLATPGEFGRTIAITGEGPNLGPALFDSTPRRVGEATHDGDLLVGLGNLCMLQNAAFPAQSAPDVFDFPDDAEQGGTLAVTFRAPVEPRSIVLVDFDKGFVRLRDRASRERIYRVPRDWTGDLIANGPPGWRTLDLTTLDPQRGFAATVSASEDAGFDARSVVELALLFHGSGAIDDLRWDPLPGP